MARLGSRPSYDRSDRIAFLVLAAAVALGAALRLWLTFTDDGIYWPDEIFQTLEPAHRLAFGYGFIPWEYTYGMRSWVLPGLIAALLKVCEAVGAADPRVYLVVVRLAFVGSSLGCAAGAYLVARAHGARRFPSAVGAAACVLYAPAIYFSHRALFETAAAFPAILGFALAVDRDASRRRTLIGSALLGLAVMIRLQTGAFGLGLIGLLLGRRQFVRAIEALGVFAVCALAYGLLDRLTWSSAPNVYLGGWFHSALAYVNFNGIEGKGSGWGTSPWDYYFTTLFQIAPVLASVAAALSIAACRRAGALWIATAIFVAAHVAVGHKELRFIVPALPFFFALTAIGLEGLPASIGRPAAAVLLAASLLSAVTFHRLTFGDLGHLPDLADTSAYDNSGSLNRLLLAARDQSRLCGLSIYGPALVWSGGYSYLHRRVPIYAFDQKQIDQHLVNFLIAPGARDLPGKVVASDGDWVLRDLGILPCERPGPLSWGL